MKNLESSLHMPTLKHLEGIHSSTVDDKNRVRIPSEWHEHFGKNEAVKMLYTGKYGIIISQAVFEKHRTNPLLIIHTMNIDDTSRFLISVDFQRAYGVILEDTVFLVGKGNHIEIHFEREKFEETKNKALQAAIALQVALIQNQ